MTMESPDVTIWRVTERAYCFIVMDNEVIQCDYLIIWISASGGKLKYYKYIQHLNPLKTRSDLKGTTSSCFQASI